MVEDLLWQRPRRYEEPAPVKRICDLFGDDQALIASDRTWAIVRPVSLTDDPGSGSVELSADPVTGKVSRDDVAAVLAAALQEPRTAGRIIYLRSGETPVAEALETFLADPP